MKTIRASDISAYLYCKRSWWYREQGIASENSQEMADGNQLHYQHGRTVFMSGLLRLAGFFILLAAVVMLAISLVNLLP